MGKAKQLHLFGKDEQEKSQNTKQNNNTTPKTNTQIASLQISESNSKKESKYKKLIDSRLKKIKNLERLYKNDQSNILKIKSLFSEMANTNLNDYCKTILSYSEKLLKRYSQKSFTKGEYEVLEYLIEENFNQLYQHNYDGETFHTLRAKFNDLKAEYHKDKKDDDEDFFDAFFVKDFKTNILKDMLRGAGINVDEDFFDDLDINDKDFEEKFQERLFEFKAREDQHTKEKIKQELTAKTNKDFAKLYKRLVKKVHPDLTTDIEEKKRREVLMKELSTVWESRDYHQLLILQNEIERDNNVGMLLDESHLKQIADALYSKIKDLEKKRFLIKREPENEFFTHNFSGRTEKNIKQKINKYIAQLDNDKKEILSNIAELKNQKTTKVFLKNVEDHLQMDYFFDPFEDFDD